MNGEPQEAELAALRETMECEKDIFSLSCSIFYSDIMTGLLSTKGK